jgi:HIRAN domain
MKPKLINEYSDYMLAGTQYFDADNNLRYNNAEGSRKGTKFDLTVEKENPYDPLAVKAMFNGKEIGYIPRETNAEIAYYLSMPESFKVECKQIKKRDDSRYYCMIAVDIFIYALVDTYYDLDSSYADTFFANYKEEYNRKQQIIAEKKRIEKQELEEKERIRKLKKEREESISLKGCFFFFLYIVIYSFILYYTEAPWWGFLGAIIIPFITVNILEKEKQKTN